MFSDDVYSSMLKSSSVVVSCADKYIKMCHVLYIYFFKNIIYCLIKNSIKYFFLPKYQVSHVAFLVLDAHFTKQKQKSGWKFWYIRSVTESSGRNRELVQKTYDQSLSHFVHAEAL